MKLPLSLLAGLVLGSTLYAQVPPEKALSTFTVSDGLELSLWATEPLFVNPTCMDIDHLGRVWVPESVNYRSKLRGQPLRRPEGDRILILEDSKGTGKADKVTVFYQSPEILAPLGIAVAKDPVGPGYKVYVCQSPDILLFEDKDGDGKADGPPKKLLSGFNGYDHDHGVHGILIGPDMKLYFSVGDTGVKGLKDKNGKVWTSNTTDCRAGTIWRCDLDGKNLEQIAHNFRNNYEPCVDSFGTVFISDNDDDGNQQTRICYVMPGGNYGYHPRGPGQTHWHEEQPGVVPKILRTGFGSPTGMCVYEGTLLPKKYWGQLLHCDAGPRHVRCYHLKPQGAGYDVDREDMVQSTDNWFRPSDVCVAPDGSVFIADWYDPGVGGHGMGDIKMGRIYRLAPKGNKSIVPKVDLESKEGLASALGSPALSVRYMAMAKLKVLAPEPEKNRRTRESSRTRQTAGEALGILWDNENHEWVRARALWQLALLGFAHEDEEILTSTIKDKTPLFRILAHRLIKEYSSTHGTPLYAEQAYKDPSPAVRREGLLQVRDIDASKAKSAILALAKRYDGKDRFYLAAIGIAVGHHDEKRREIILADFEKQFPEWNDKVADLVWELRPPAVLATLDKKLSDKSLTATQRARIVDILASADDLGAGKALLGVLNQDVADEVRERVVENLKLFLPGKWRELRASKDLGNVIESLLHSDLSAKRQAGLGLIAVAETNDAVKQVAAIAGDAKETLALRKTAVQTLGALPPVEASAALAELLKTEPAALRADVVQAIGEQARNEKRPAAAPALKTLETLVAAKDGEPALKQLAAAALAGSRSGTVWLLAANDKKELPEALKPEVGRLLRNSPYQDLRNKAMIAFPPAGRIDPKNMPSIATLITRKGNPQHGKQVLAASVKGEMQCLKCHTIRGVGGAIGPDLSMIGKKASRENLFESILFPSKAVADQYISWVITTKNDLIVTGLLIEETPDYVLLRDANGKDTKFAKKDIESRAKDPKSIMPENLLVTMTEDDMVDMVEYLFSLKTATLALDSWKIAGPFDNGSGDEGLDKVFPPEKGIDFNAAYQGKAGKVTWRTVKPNADGFVDLKTFLAPESNSVVSYLVREVESPADQEAVILLGTDDGARLWVNDKQVYENRSHRAAVPEQDSVKVALKKGVNKVLLKINNGDGDHGFYFVMLTEQELKPVARK